MILISSFKTRNFFWEQLPTLLSTLAKTFNLIWTSFIFYHKILPTANIRREIRAAAQQSWSQSWNIDVEISTKASITRAFIPDTLAPSHLHSVEVPYQVATADWALPASELQLSKVKCTPSHLCTWNNAIEPFDHFLFHCTQFDTIRVHYIATSLRFCKMRPPPLSARRTSILMFFIVKSSRSVFFVVIYFFYYNKKNYNKNYNKIYFCCY